jgi:hypothetical protein
MRPSASEMVDHIDHLIVEYHDCDPHKFAIDFEDFDVSFLQSQNAFNLAL